MSMFDDAREIEVEVYESKSSEGNGIKRTIAMMLTIILGSIAIFTAVWEVAIQGIFSADSSWTERMLWIIIFALPIIVAYFHGKRIYRKPCKFVGIWGRIIVSGTLIPTIITSIPLAVFNSDSGMSTGNYVLILFLVYLCISAIIALITAVIITALKWKRG